MRKSIENERGIFLPSLKAQIGWVISGISLLFIFCMIAYSTEDPCSMIKPLSLTALYLSSAIGGFCAMKLSGKLASGLISGIFTALFIFFLSVIPICKTGNDIGTSLILNSLIIPSSFLGAFIAKPRRASPKKHRSRIKKIRR